MGEARNGIAKPRLSVDIHRWAAVAMALLLLIHLILNWRWIVVTLTRFLKGEL